MPAEVDKALYKINVSKKPELHHRLEMQIYFFMNECTLILADSFRSWFVGRAQGTGISCPASLEILLYVQQCCR